MTSTFEGDCLIGADGLRSFVRERLFGAQPSLRFSGYEAWRTLAPIDQVPSELRQPETNLWLGPDAHVVHYPVRGGSVVNLAVILGKQRRDAPPAESWSSPGDPEKIGRRFADWHPLLRALIAAPADWQSWPLYTLAPLSRWTAQRVALLGDAAHPMLPFLAQGAAQAIEDATALSAALREHPHIDQALGAYAAARLERTAKLQQASEKQGRIYHLAGARAVVRDIGMQALGPQRMLMRNDWIYRR
jgi:salicylate hydroxylase